MDDRFHQNVSSIFGVLLHDPSSIVDDTAVERLLTMLQDHCTEKDDPVFSRQAVAFWEDPKIWDSETTLSFALRLSTRFKASFQEEWSRNESVLSFHREILSRDIFNSSNIVKFAVYSSLHHVVVSMGTRPSSSKQMEKWISFIEDFLPRMLEDLLIQSMFVRNIACKFMAEYWNLTLSGGNAADLIQQLQEFFQRCSRHSESIANCLLELVIVNLNSAVHVIRGISFMDTMTNVLSSEAGGDNQVKKSMIDLVSIINQSISICWNDIFNSDTTSEDPYNRFNGCLNALEAQHSNLTPLLCLALFKPVIQKDVSMEWNQLLLKRLQKCSTFLDDVDTVKKWKARLMVVVDSYGKVPKQVYEHNGCKTVFNSWCSAAVHLLNCTLGLNMSSTQLDRHFVLLMNNQKMTRLFFSFFKQINVEYLSEEVCSRLIRSLLEVVTSISVSVQFQCSAFAVLENIASFDEHRGLVPRECKEYFHMTFGCLLSMKLQNGEWETKDSVLTLIDVIINATGADVYRYFGDDGNTCTNVSTRDNMENSSGDNNDGKWCNQILELINDEESFVRAKSFNVLRRIMLVAGVRNVFLKRTKLTMRDVWDKIRGVFLNTYRADDLFTRRSILELIASWVDGRIFNNDHSGKDISNILNSDNNNDKQNNSNCHGKTTFPLYDIKDILVNAVCDFDWETRLACLNVLLVIVRTHGEKSTEFCASIFDSVVGRSVLDVEINVQKKALLCLYKLQQQLKSYVETETTKHAKQHNTMDELKELILHYIKENNFCDDTLKRFVASFDFGELLLCLTAMDEYVQLDSVSFMDDILASVHKKDENLLIDCY